MSGRASRYLPPGDSVERAVDRVLSGGLIFAVAAVTIQTAMHVVNAAFIGSTQLDANAEGNPPAWAHGAAISTGAFVCALHALLTTERRRDFIALAAILAFLSLDEVAVVHERIATRALTVVGLPAVWDSVLWPALYAPLLGGLAVLLVAIARAAPARAGRFTLVGLSLLAAALVAEVASAPVSADEGWAHAVEGAFEEGAELGGWIVLTVGLTAIALTDVFRTLAADSGGPAGDAPGGEIVHREAQDQCGLA